MPDASDASFWGNWGDPRWSEYLARRRQATGAFLEFVKQHLPENFPLMTCCTSCAYGGNNFCAQCADEMLRGDNILNLEICGDNPSDVCERLASGSHHAGTAEKHGAPVIAIGYGFHTDSAGHLWALNHMSGFSTWFSTLKGRLGLPEELLATLPDDAASIARAFAFEREHPELFCEGLLHDCAVYFSETTKTESFFGACEQGATRDYRELMRTLFTAGFRPETIFDFPGDAASCPCVLVPSAAVMRPEEAAGMEDYLNAGGIVLRFGPDSTAGYPDAPEEFESLRWLCGERFDESMLPDEWHEVRPGLFRNPSRRPGGLPEFLRKFIRNDLLAAEVMNRLGDYGIRVPDDIALIGFSGSPYSGWLPVPLTTFEHPIEEMCRCTMFLLKSGNPSDNARSHIFENKLVLRKSHGPTKGLEKGEVS